MAVVVENRWTYVYKFASDFCWPKIKDFKEERN